MSQIQQPSDSLAEANIGSSQSGKATQNPPLSVKKGGNIQPKQQDKPVLALAWDVPIDPSQQDHNLIGLTVDLRAPPGRILLNPQMGTGN